jgi:DNA-binding response OmpR family regulator
VSKRRILIAGAATEDLKQFVSEFVESSNLEARFSSGPADFFDELRSWLPDLVIVDEKFSSPATQLVARVRAEFSRVAMKILVLAHEPSVEQTLDFVRKGVDDVVRLPFVPRLLALRARYQLQEREIFREGDLYSDPSMAPAALELFYGALGRMLQDDFKTHLQACLFEVARATKSMRVNVIELKDLTQDKAVRLASSDIEDSPKRELDLGEYPEIREALFRKALVYIKNIDSNPLTKHIRGKLKDIEMDSIVVCPLLWGDTCDAVLSLRFQGEEGLHFSKKHLRTFYMLAQIISLRRKLPR